jgi:membrane protein YdbS with pleckstrin-like domain
MPTHDQTPDKEPEPLMTRFVHACLLLLVAVVALWLAVQLLARFWGWLLLIALTALLIAASVWIMRWRRNRW